VQASGKSEDVGDHGGMPATIKSEDVHFRDGLLGRPVIKSDAVGSDKNARAVFAKFAMNKNFLERSLAEDGEKFGELGGRGRGEAAHGNGNEMHAERFGLKALLFACVV